MIIPLGARVLVEPLRARSQTSGGIALPDSVKDNVQEGVVVAAGAACYDEFHIFGGNGNGLEVDEVGATVLYEMNSGIKLNRDGASLVLLKEDEVIAIVDTDDADDAP